MIRWLILSLLLWAMPASAIGVDAGMLDDPVEEARAQAIMADIRCLVCQNQSILDSDADLAGDLRAIVRERVAAGDDAAAVKAWLVARYGDWVLMQPPFKSSTLLLWAAPFLALLLGGGLVIAALRRRPPPPPLSPDEQAQAAKLLRDEP